MDMPTDQIAPSWVWVMLTGLGMAIAALCYSVRFLFGKLMSQNDAHVKEMKDLVAMAVTAINSNTAAVDSLKRHLKGTDE